jgi:hypothetical protein
MAKTARKNRRRNARRKERRLRAAMRGEASDAPRRDIGQLMMFLRYQNQQTSHGDARKEKNKKACRGKVRKEDF